MGAVSRQAGFSLVELTIVIVISGIIAGSVALFFRPAVDGYFDTRRRAVLTDEADTALRRIGREVRLAVPNSIRTPSAACFELVPSKAGGLYRRAADGVNAGSDPLDTTAPDLSFDVLSPLAAVPLPGDFVVVGNQNTDDVYTGATRGSVAAWAAPPVPGGAALGQGRITLAAATQFPAAYDGGRFFVVDGTAPSVYYICRNPGLADGSGTGQLVRVVRNLTPAAAAACPNDVGAVLATRVAACSFTYSPAAGATQQSGLLWLQLDLQESGERATLAYGVHVSNVP